MSTIVTFCCVSCRSSNTAIIRSSVNSGGRRRRLVHCHDCGHCSCYVNDKPAAAEAPKSASRRYRFTDAIIQQVLQSRETHASVASKLGCTTELIRQIRIGGSYRNACPGVPRWHLAVLASPIDSLTCRCCKHWDGAQCGLGFPDPIAEGIGFAADCNMYVSD